MFLFTLTLASCGAREGKPAATSEVSETSGISTDTDDNYFYVVEMDAAKATAGIALDTIRLGHIRRDETVEYRLGIRNTGTEPFVILEAQNACGCTRVIYEKEPILPGRTSTMTVIYDATGQQGSHVKLVRLRTSLAEARYPLMLFVEIVR